jgi:hypothetical protein
MRLRERFADNFNPLGDRRATCRSHFANTTARKLSYRYKLLTTLVVNNFAMILLAPV